MERLHYETPKPPPPSAWVEFGKTLAGLSVLASLVYWGGRLFDRLFL